MAILELCANEIAAKLIIDKKELAGFVKPVSSFCFAKRQEVPPKLLQSKLWPSVILLLPQVGI